MFGLRAWTMIRLKEKQKNMVKKTMRQPWGLVSFVELLLLLAGYVDNLVISFDDHLYLLQKQRATYHWRSWMG